jgi:hypothetical protein
MDQNHDGFAESAPFLQCVDRVHVLLIAGRTYFTSCVDPLGFCLEQYGYLLAADSLGTTPTPLPVDTSHVPVMSILVEGMDPTTGNLELRLSTDQNYWPTGNAEAWVNAHRVAKFTANASVVDEVIPGVSVETIPLAHSEATLGLFEPGHYEVQIRVPCELPRGPDLLYSSVIYTFDVAGTTGHLDLIGLSFVSPTLFIQTRKE